MCVVQTALLRLQHAADVHELSWRHSPEGPCNKPHRCTEVAEDAAQLLLPQCFAPILGSVLLQARKCDGARVVLHSKKGYKVDTINLTGKCPWQVRVLQGCNRPLSVPYP